MRGAATALWGGGDELGPLEQARRDPDSPLRSHEALTRMETSLNDVFANVPLERLRIALSKMSLIDAPVEKRLPWISQSCQEFNL